MKVLSLGAGVQSSALALMAATGELETPECAIFADTGWEPITVYEWLEWLEEQLPYPVYRVSKGNLREDLLKAAQEGGRVSGVPFFMSNGGIGRRQCTYDYKLAPVRRKMRKMGATSKNPIEVWIGISLDETHRMKDSNVQYAVHRWPLIDKRMNRNDCIRWMADHDYQEPPRSACLGCPFHGDGYWRKLKMGNADE